MMKCPLPIPACLIVGAAVIGLLLLVGGKKKPAPATAAK